MAFVKVTRFSAESQSRRCRRSYSRFLRPAKLCVWLWQLGQSKRKFSRRLSSGTPFMWSRDNVSGAPFHEGPIPHDAQLFASSPSLISRCLRYHLDALECSTSAVPRKLSDLVKRRPRLAL